MTTPTVTPPPEAPNRLASGFSAAFGPFLAWIVVFAGEITAAIAWISAQVVAVATAVSAAETARASAEVAASAASVSAGASAHVPDADYEAGAKVWSNVDFQTYRAQTDHSDVATDPSADAVNWEPLDNLSIKPQTAFDGMDVLPFRTIAANVSGGAIAINLPANPALSDWVAVAVLAGDLATNNLTINGIGALINGGPDLVLKSNDDNAVTLIFDGVQWLSLGAGASETNQRQRNFSLWTGA